MTEISQKKRDGWVPPEGKSTPEPTTEGLKWFKDVKSEPIDWLWYPYVPLRKLTILGGDPGMGKTFISTAIAAAVSLGERLPGMEEPALPPSNVLLLSAEDDPSDTIKPRLELFHADMTRIAIYDRPLSLDAYGLQKIRLLMGEVQAKLIIIDPIVAYLGAKVDMNRSNEVRPLMQGLKDIVYEMNAAGIIVRHLRKAPAGARHGKEIYAGGGSIDFTAAVRSELQVSEGRDGQRYLNHIKANAGRQGRSIKYSIVDDRFIWGDLVDKMPSFSRTAPKVSTKLKSEAVIRQFIFDMLKDHPEGVPSTDVYMAAKAKGFSDTKINLVKKGLVVSVKSGSHWLWMLDPAAPPFDNDELPVVE